MTYPNTVKLLFIEQASFKRSFLAAVFFTFSLPAKSTMKNYDNFWVFFPFEFLIYFKVIIIIV